MAVHIVELQLFDVFLLQHENITKDFVVDGPDVGHLGDPQSAGVLRACQIRILVQSLSLDSSNLFQLLVLPEGVLLNSLLEGGLQDVDVREEVGRQPGQLDLIHEASVCLGVLDVCELRLLVAAGGLYLLKGLLELWLVLEEVFHVELLPLALVDHFRTPELDEVGHHVPELVEVVGLGGLEGEVIPEQSPNLVGLLDFLVTDVVPDGDAMLLLRELQGLVPASLAIGDHAHERVEQQVYYRFDIADFGRQQRCIPSHHSRTLLGDVVGHQKLELLSFVHVHDSVEGVVIDGDVLLAAEGHCASRMHVVSFSEALEDARHREEAAIISFPHLLLVKLLLL